MHLDDSPLVCTAICLIPLRNNLISWKQRASEVSLREDHPLRQNRVLSCPPPHGLSSLPARIAMTPNTVSTNGGILTSPGIGMAFCDEFRVSTSLRCSKIKSSVAHEQRRQESQCRKTSPVNLITDCSPWLQPDSLPRRDRRFFTSGVTFDAGGSGCGGDRMVMTWSWRSSSLRPTPPLPSTADQPRSNETKQGQCGWFRNRSVTVGYGSDQADPRRRLRGKRRTSHGRKDCSGRR
jgi:hypothetical protein